MSGQDLAKKLRDLGFSDVRGHMTALDDFEVLQIQGVLEAHGLIQESGRTTVDAGGGLVLRKKKKKPTATTGAACVSYCRTIPTKSRCSMSRPIAGRLTSNLLPDGGLSRPTGAAGTTSIKS